MIQSELKKLKYKFPQELKMPWEKGFAGLVLQQGSQVIEGALHGQEQHESMGGGACRDCGDEVKARRESK